MGKTTLAVHITGILLKQKQGRILLVDCDMDNLAAGVSQEEISRSYPSLTAEDVKAALTYAAELTREKIINRG